MTKPETWTASLLAPSQLAQLPSFVWLIDRLLPSVGLGLLFGESGTLKTFLLLDMLLSTSAGVPFSGMRTTKTRVVYVALEGQEGIHPRIEAWLAEHPDARADVEANFRVVLVPLHLFTAKQQGILSAFIEGLRSFAPGAIAVDTLSRTMDGGDENANVDMGVVIKACQEIESALGALTLLVHHQAKNANKARPTPRGASNLPAAADVILHVSRAASRVTLRTAKQKNGQEVADLRFGVKVVDLGERDGERQTSLVLVPDEASVAPELTGAGLQGTVLEALALLPEGITASDLAERIEGRRKASGSLNRALVDLVERGLVQKQGRTYVIAQSQASVANLHAA